MNKRGFTLIELLVSIAILGLMAVIVGPNIGKSKNDQLLYQSSQEIKTKLLETQGYSLAPPEDNDSFEYYGLKIEKISSSNPQIKYSVIKLKNVSSGTGIQIEPVGDASIIDDIELVSAEQIIWYKVVEGSVFTTGISPSNPPTSTMISDIKIENNQGNRKTISLNSTTGAINVQDN